MPDAPEPDWAMYEEPLTLLDPEEVHARSMAAYRIENRIGLMVQRPEAFASLRDALSRDTVGGMTETKTKTKSLREAMEEAAEEAGTTLPALLGEATASILWTVMATRAAQRGQTARVVLYGTFMVRGAMEFHARRIRVAIERGAKAIHEGRVG